MAVRGLWVAAVLAMGVWASQAVAGGGIQRSAQSVHPSPRHADDDRGRAYKDGCNIEKPGTTSPPCVYGHRHSATTVVLFGDSHALHFFPALLRLARRHDWRLVNLTKSGCPPAEVDVYYRRERRFYSECGVWRHAMLRRMETQEKPALVVTSASLFTAVQENGKVLPRRKARQALANGYAAVVKRLVADGSHVVAIRDVPVPPRSIPRCVAKEMHHLRRCAFDKRDALPHPDPVTDALRQVDGVRVIDPANAICVGRLCPAVVDDVLVYRDAGHLTATFSATLAPWLNRKLGDLP